MCSDSPSLSCLFSFYTILYPLLFNSKNFLFSSIIYFCRTEYYCDRAADKEIKSLSVTVRCNHCKWKGPLNLYLEVATYVL